NGRALGAVPHLCRAVPVADRGLRQPGQGAHAAFAGLTPLTSCVPAPKMRGSHLPRWRNWSTHWVQVLAGKTVEVRVLSWAPTMQTTNPAASGVFCCLMLAA